MKRPIAELLTMTIKAGAEVEHTQYEHEAWQILRRKQGSVTHRVYQQLNDPLQRLVYSAWESKKGVDGARQYLQGTPLMRRARAVLSATPQRLVVELAGVITSTKGLHLPADAVAATAIQRLTEGAGDWHVREEQSWKKLSSRSGHITHVIFHAFDDPMTVGSMSHWADVGAFEHARVEKDSSGDVPAAYIVYRPVQD
jgi:hypothetical protein